MNMQHVLKPGLTVRVRQPELMDQPGLDDRQHCEALDGLARVNWWSRSVAVFWAAVRRLAAATDRPLRVLDIGCGGGDVTIGLARQAVRSGLPLEVCGMDLSATALRVAADRATRLGMQAQFLQSDVLSDPLPSGFDIILCSLFLHHLSDEDAATLMRRMADATTRLALINDLLRCRRGYWLAVAGTRLLTRSHIVHVDGPLSVQAAFTVPEIRAMTAQAGLKGETVTRHWPFRFLWSWSRR